MATFREYRRHDDSFPCDAIGSPFPLWHTASLLVFPATTVNSFEWLIGARYTRAKRRNGFISFISAFSMIGIALSVIVLITVLSVMNGFQREIRGRILEVASHIQVSGEEGHLADWQTVATELHNKPGVVAAAPYVQSQSLLSFDGKFQGAIIRGILPDQEAKVADIGKHMVAGRLENLQPGEFGIVLGRELARAMDIKLGDKVAVATPQGNMSPAGLIPRLKTFTVVGIFWIDMYQYDASLALISMPDAQRLYRLGDDVTGVRLKLNDPLDAPYVARQLQAQSQRPLWFSDWTMENASYFRAVEVEKTMMTLILTLIVAIAAFNLVSGLVMAVTDKQADIAILRTLGASPRSIMAIFIIQGATVGILGAVIGVVGGVLLGANVGDVVHLLERLFHFHALDSQVYLINELPSQVERTDVLLVGAISLGLSLIATVYPSWRAARVNPAEALRYE